MRGEIGLLLWDWSLRGTQQGLQVFLFHLKKMGPILFSLLKSGHVYLNLDRN